MGQITFYLDDELEQQMNRMIAQEKQVKNTWLAEAIEQRLNNGWRTETRELVGAWKDVSSVDSYRHEGRDIERETL